MIFLSSPGKRTSIFGDEHRILQHLMDQTWREEDQYFLYHRMLPTHVLYADFMTWMSPVFVEKKDSTALNSMSTTQQK